MAWMLAGILLHLARGGLPPTLWNGIAVQRLSFLAGFVITTMVVNYAFHGARHHATLIDGGHWPGRRLIQGAIGLVGAALTLALSARPATAPPRWST